MSKRLALIVMCTAFVPGCSAEGTGDAAIRWSVGLTGSCNEASLQTVSVRIETDDGILVARRDEFCHVGEVLFTDLPVGSYRARLVAYDDAGFAAYETRVDRVSIVEGVEPEPYLGRLAPRPAEIGLLWYFQGGRLCSAYDVSEIDVHLFTDDVEVATESFRCDQGEAVIRDLRPGVYDLLLDGRDDRGRLTHAFTLANVVLRPGHEVAIEAPLVPCDGLCF